MKANNAYIIDDGNGHSLITVTLDYQYFKQDLTTFEKRVISMIPKGGQRRVSQAELANLLSTTKRVIREAILSATKKGVPIVTDNSNKTGGYYIARTKEELNNGIRKAKHQANETLNRMVGLANADLSKWS